MHSLRTLFLDHNRLSGALPAMFPAIGEYRLADIRLNDNNFTGPFSFQAEFQVIGAMDALDISNNQFTEMDEKICELSVIDGQGELVDLRADCDICRCKSFCDICT